MEPGLVRKCVNRLIAYQNDLRQQPAEKSKVDWINFVDEYYHPTATKRWCFSSYYHIRNLRSLPRQIYDNTWHCNICYRQPAKGFEANPLLCMLRFTPEKVIDEILVFLGVPRGTLLNGNMILDYEYAAEQTVYQQYRVVHAGRARITFDPNNLKILSWDFCCRCHEMLVSARLLPVSQVNGLIRRQNLNILGFSVFIMKYLKNMAQSAEISHEVSRVRDSPLKAQQVGPIDGHSQAATCPLDRHLLPPILLDACVTRLINYQNDLRKHPTVNPVMYWFDFFREYYSPTAKKRWCFTSYTNIDLRVDVPRQLYNGTWHCEICDTQPGKGFEVTQDYFSGPGLCLLTFNSEGVIDEILDLELPHGTLLSNGNIILDYEKAAEQTIYPLFRIVREGSLRITFDDNLKILCWDFCCRGHQTLVHTTRYSVNELVRRQNLNTLGFTAYFMNILQSVETLHKLRESLRAQQIGAINDPADDQNVDNNDGNHE